MVVVFSVCVCVCVCVRVSVSSLWCLSVAIIQRLTSLTPFTTQPEHCPLWRRPGVGADAVCGGAGGGCQRPPQQRYPPRRAGRCPRPVQVRVVVLVIGRQDALGERGSDCRRSGMLRYVHMNWRCVRENGGKGGVTKLCCDGLAVLTSADGFDGVRW